MAAAGTRNRTVKKQIKVPKKLGPEFDVNSTWPTLSRNIREIQRNNAHNLSFEENHRFGYNMVLYKHGDVLYRGLRELVVEHLDELAEEWIVPAFPVDRVQQTGEGEVLLKALRRVWEDHIESMKKIGQILKYMDRVYVEKAEVKQTWNLGLELFIQRIIRPPIQNHLVTAILGQIRYEREGHTVNRSAIQGCVDVFLRLRDDSGVTIFNRDVEPAFLEQSMVFYEEEGKKLVQSCDAPEFLFKAEERFVSEDSRTHHYLSSHIAPAVKQILKDHLLSPHISDLISMPGSGLDIMIDTEKIDVLSRLYRLYILVPLGLSTLKNALKESIGRRGKAINDASSGPDASEVAELAEDLKGKGKARAKVQANSVTPATEWVERVLELKDQFDKIWQEAFQQNHVLEVSINEAFESFINQNAKCSEFLSLFIDNHLKKDFKGKTDAEIASILDKTISIFRFVTEKDIFERYYKGHLSKRLLHNRSVSEDAEREMLSRLKVECGYQFTQKLEGMFNDIKLSAEAMEGYQKHLRKTTSPEVAISVIVMTSTYWPVSHVQTPCHVPVILAKSSESFQQFYLARHTGRQLTWQYGFGNADVHTQFRKEAHDLNVSTYALIILLLFQDLGDDDFLTYSEIKEATAIVDHELKRQLQSLACGKFKVLKKHPHGKEVNDDDSFSFNNDFSSTITKIKIATISSKIESKEERKETHDRIEEERKYLLDACIVRIMKDRKHMTHIDLVNETVKQVANRFAPEPMLIKRRIEILIEKEYLERCADRKSYNYVA